MSTPDRLHALLDLSLRHSLKNLVSRQNPPASGRNRLLAAAAQQQMIPHRTPVEHRWIRTSFRISFRLYTGLQETKSLPGYGNLLDTISILKSSMLVP